MAPSRKETALTTLLVLALSLQRTDAFAPASTLARRTRPSSAVGGIGGFVQEPTKNVASFPNVRTSGSDLQMSAAPAVSAGVGALAGAVSGGVFAGGLHAIAGPDHLAALLPRCCGQRWYRAGRIGALWGMGHGVSATILGVCAFALKSRMSKMGAFSRVVRGASSFMEIAVGASLVFIGLLGIKEAREWEAEIEGGVPQSLSAAAGEDGMKVAQKRAVVFNGVLHGFSWDGAPSLAPAIAVATWRGNITFLLAYALGTMGAMTIATTLIGEGTRKAGEVLHRPDIPQKLSYVSSIIAIGVGLFWCSLALN
uniref:Nickel/cobalt efflux system n=1 Tax=Pseudictyota dubia TaxID=2749911 RepID=A0A7R9ZBQ6_9STRA|mmetsp:Transcript_37533/g.69411  ORF Transcript_37533/g.69411 Transcript_37533/m.69411 type:complete len:311 (+) Transcript_37533:104-1036(+)